jgi:hypothetical protein
MTQGDNSTERHYCGAASYPVLNWPHFLQTRGGGYKRFVAKTLQTLKRGWGVWEEVNFSLNMVFLNAAFF